MARKAKPTPARQRTSFNQSPIRKKKPTRRRKAGQQKEEWRDPETGLTAAELEQRLKQLKADFMSRHAADPPA